MSATTRAELPFDTTAPIDYPDSDGMPMADNTLQFRWIVTIQGGFDALYRDDPNVFVAGDLLWYPVEGQPKIRLAPDALIAFGRPKGYRGSYKQWEEAGVAPQIVFEVLSPGNSVAEMMRKFTFYQRYGVEEYYVYDPDHGTLDGWTRSAGGLEQIDNADGWISPRTQVTLLLKGNDLVILRPDGRYFASYVELEQQREQAEQERAAADARAAQERQQREQAEQQLIAADARAARLAERLRALGVDPDAADA
jgi:Uma2 family endonuclease